MLRREDILPKLIPSVGDYLVVAGLGNAVFDLARLTDNAPSVYPLDGVMGAAVSMGLGVALARPDRRVVVVTGDGEVLMNVGALATVAVQNPANLSILCLDNGEYGLTGGQLTHTSFGADLAATAAALGIRRTVTVRDESGIEDAAMLLATSTDACFVLARVARGNSAKYAVDRDGAACRVRFRSAALSRTSRL